MIKKIGEQKFQFSHFNEFYGEFNFYLLYLFYALLKVKSYFSVKKKNDLFKIQI